MGKTADEVAFGVLLAPGSEKTRARKLKALHVATTKALNNELPCPDCGHEGPHDDNGETGIHRAYCCAGCGMHFDHHPL